MTKAEQQGILNQIELAYISYPEDRKYEFIYNSAVSHLRSLILNHFYEMEEDDERRAKESTGGNANG